MTSRRRHGSADEQPDASNVADMLFVARIKLRCACFWDLKKELARLIDKWNGIEFARQHNVPVPEIYWHGRTASEIPFDELPPLCVVKGSRGYNGRRVFIIENGRHRGDPPLTHRQIQHQLDSGRLSPAETFLVQEYVTTDGTTAVPLEYQFHMFGERIGAVQFVDENASTHRFYHADWTPFTFRVARHREDSELRKVPEGFDRVCEFARRLGRAWGHFVRIDFLQSQSGFLFSEFCATPMGGACYTDAADRYFGEMWQQEFSELL